jgi:hypothetical protein
MVLHSSLPPNSNLTLLSGGKNKSDILPLFSLHISGPRNNKSEDGSLFQLILSQILKVSGCRGGSASESCLIDSAHETAGLAPPWCLVLAHGNAVLAADTVTGKSYPGNLLLHQFCCTVPCKPHHHLCQQNACMHIGFRFSLKIPS